MPKIPVNLHDVKEPECVEPGTYALRITSLKAKLSKAGNAMHEITFSFTEDGLQHNRIWDRIMEAGADWRWKQLFDACGVDYDETGFDTDDLVHAECKAAIDKEIYEGKEKNVIVR